MRTLSDDGLVGEDGFHVACTVWPGHGNEHPLGGELRADCAAAEDYRETGGRGAGYGVEGPVFASGGVVVGDHGSVEVGEG